MTLNTFRFFHQAPTLPGFGLSFGISTLYLSLVILFPISALLVYVSDLSWAQYWQAISDRRVVASYWVTVSGAFYSTIAATLIGLLLAWIITRYDFPGRRLVDALVDLPFALPTSVAGLTLATLLVPGGWLGQWFDAMGIKIAYAYPGILIAMTFTSLPFVVRTVQPVLLEMGNDYEEAGRTLGASKLQIFFYVMLPTLYPALITGAAQSFVRGLGEFGAVIMIAGNMPFKTEVSSLMIFVRLQEFDYGAASAIASVILLASLAMLFTLQVIQSHIFRWQRKK
ncbi:sulfate ABC transporter permease subunit CysT [Pseudomonas sp.]|uniref:Sulfate transport system permease protein CysT n=1 Tax=Serpens gallinarum TaxID=2763075 RepID=A0ABR8TQR3_9PSED|nr:sulfate ABC transporter permease subunit CysT [Pseudomonas sp.]MBD7978095.1 sulfate ABC transporter permease subunit CysT [Serpens gallinarum]MBF0674835.1 sulfate ABC transporter permease subunit CysT [Pseudomonas sp.]